jgi:hypothetical protein
MLQHGRLVSDEAEVKQHLRHWDEP